MQNNIMELSMRKLLKFSCFVQWNSRKQQYANYNWIMKKYMSNLAFILKVFVLLIIISGIA